MDSSRFMTMTNLHIISANHTVIQALLLAGIKALAFKKKSLKPLFFFFFFTKIPTS